MESCTSEPKGLIAKWRKRRTLRKQIRCIGLDLARDYGKKSSYFTQEVRTAWVRRGYSPDCMFYAIGAFLRPEISTTIISNVVKLATTMKSGKQLEIFVLTAISISALMILWVPVPF